MKDIGLQCYEMSPTITHVTELWLCFNLEVQYTNSPHNKLRSLIQSFGPETSKMKNNIDSNYILRSNKRSPRKCPESTIMKN